MFKIEGTTIHITRGDKGSINFKIKDYEFGPEDVVRFRVYNKKGFDQEPVITKEIEITESVDSVSIDLTSDDTKIGTYENKAIVYWYEIELNGNQTIIGYDELGAKEFILYPEGE